MYSGMHAARIRAMSYGNAVSDSYADSKDDSKTGEVHFLVTM